MTRIYPMAKEPAASIAGLGLDSRANIRSMHSLPADLTTWQQALYFQIKERPRTVEQLMSANALSEPKVVELLAELRALGLAVEDDGLWRLA
jgi:predicted Rossmann fold nucleotide-binding protein DprA/Smf involved in DNA uptake